MYHTKIKRGFQLLVLIALVTFAFQPGFASNGPELPPQCSSIVVDPGHQLAFHVYARGVQVYKWNGVGWDFVEPRAALFAEDSFHGEVGTHFRGPNWQSKSGSRDETTAAGIFRGITYIQRVNTTGGLRPTDPGTVFDEIKEVEYTAEYYFYRAENPNGN